MGAVQVMQRADCPGDGFGSDWALIMQGQLSNDTPLAGSLAICLQHARMLAAYLQIISRRPAGLDSVPGLLHHRPERAAGVPAASRRDFHTVQLAEDAGGRSQEPAVCAGASRRGSSEDGQRDGSGDPKDIGAAEQSGHQIWHPELGGGGGGGSKAKHVWIKLKWSVEFKSVDSLRSKLVYHNTVMNLLLTSVGNSSLGRIETSTKTLQSDIADIKSHLQISHDKSNSSPPLASVVEDEVYKLSLSAELMRNAETLQPWSSISVDKWVQSGKWWLLRSQMELHAPTKPNEHSVPVSAYTNLIKASWILVDIIDHHPQLPLVTPDTRHEVLLLAAELKREFRRINDLSLAIPDWQMIEEQDLRVWENNTKGPVLQPGKRTQKTDLVQTQTDFWVVQGEQVYFQKFATYQRSDISEPQTCVVLFLMHEHERTGRLVAQDQNESTLVEFKLREDLSLGVVKEHGKALEIGYNSDINATLYGMAEREKDIDSLKIGAELLRFYTETDVETLLTLIESAYVYLFRRDSDTLNLEIFRAFALMIATKNGCENVVNQLQQKSSILDSKTLSSALAVGSSPAPGANDRFVSYLNNSLCFWAVEHGLIGIIRILLAERLRMNMGRYLSYAAELQQENVVRILLENGADPDCTDYLSSRKFRAIHTPLGEVSSRGHLKLTQMLLEKGASINAKGGGGMTALHLAVGEGHTAVVDLLLAEKEVDVSAVQSSDASSKEDVSEEGVTALHVAVRKGHYDIAQKLVERGANVNAQETFVQRYEGNPGWYHHLYTWGRTPLLLAVEMASKSQEKPGLWLDMMRLLLDHGADVNAEARREEESPAYAWGPTDRYGRMSSITPLYAAIESRDETLALGMVQLLLLHGANVDVQAWDEDESESERVPVTPLHKAIERGYKSIVRVLLEAGARRDQKAVELAQERKTREIEQLLQEMDIK